MDPILFYGVPAGCSFGAITSFFSAFSPLWPAFEGAEEGEKEVLRSVGRRKVRKAFDQLARLLDGRTWLAGDGPTVADAYFIGIVRWNDFHEVLDLAAYPTLQAEASEGARLAA